MNMLKMLLLYLAFIFKAVDKVESDCSLSLSKDFGKPQPIFIQNGAFLAPTTDGTITVSQSEALLIACPGHNNILILSNETTNINFTKSQCVSDNVFRVGEWQGPLKNITCNEPPWYTADRTGQKCYGGNEVIRVGYKIFEDFFALYEACFDQSLLSTLYVRHTVGPASVYTQNGRNRPQFTEGGLFGKIKMSQLYKIQNQKIRLNTLLGPDMDKLYLTKKQFLTRGHLAPRADFPLRGSQRPSFSYVNTAPQWMRGNAGDWASLEESIRRRLKQLGREVTLYTGTYGVMTLPHNDGTLQELYLHDDENNNRLVPVPMYLYKVIYDPVSKSAAVFISINSSYYNSTMLEELTFCEDICQENPDYQWLKWRSNDGTFSFCCDYKDFVKTVKHLPNLEVNARFF